jgi:hypothetical protein
MSRHRITMSEVLTRTYGYPCKRARRGAHAAEIFGRTAAMSLLEAESVRDKMCGWHVDAIGHTQINTAASKLD